MVRTQTTIKHRWLVLFVLTLASVIFTGCNNGSLGIKTGSISGYILDDDTNQPISEVLVRATTESDNKSTYTDGDGSFCFGDVAKGAWTISIEKYGYTIATESTNHLTCTVSNGETFVMSPLKLSRNTSNVKGTLKGYPIDAVTGRAITNFTVTQDTPYNNKKSKTFDSAADFRDTGWTGLEGGAHNYSITAPNYETWTSVTGNAEGITIGKSVANLGTIKMTPLTVSVSGTFHGVPGYVLDNKNMVVWAESAGKVVASYTTLDDNTSKGTLTYLIEGIPVTAGTVAVKCKARGYDTIVINSAVSIAGANPGGVIAGVDLDFAVQEPITTDLRVIIRSSEPDDENPMGTFGTGEVARVYVQTGSTNVAYADVTSVNYGGEVTISGVITGYPLKVIAVNQNRKYCSVTSEDITIPEESNIYPITLLLAKD